MNQQGRYRCSYVNVEVGQSAREAVGEAMRAILGELGSWARTVLNDDFIDNLWPAVLERYGPHGPLASEPLLTGVEVAQGLHKDDVDYVSDLGLIKQAVGPDPAGQSHLPGSDPPGTGLGHPGGSGGTDGLVPAAGRAVGPGPTVVGVPGVLPGARRALGGAVSVP